MKPKASYIKPSTITKKLDYCMVITAFFRLGYGFSCIATNS
jgi:hypothetical protein